MEAGEGGTWRGWRSPAPASDHGSGVGAVPQAHPEVHPPMESVWPKGLPGIRQPVRRLNYVHFGEKVYAMLALHEVRVGEGR